MPARGTKIITPLPVAAQRLRARAVPSGDGCLIMTRTDKYGYGFVKINQVMWKAHRLVYVAAHGEIPDGWHLHHICGNRACITIEHLEPRDPSEHVREHNPHKAHCPAGHPFSGDNLYVHPDGWYVCRTCQRKNSAAHYRRVNATKMATAKKSHAIRSEVFRTALADGPKTVAELRDLDDRVDASVRTTLARMVAHGEIRSVARGIYALA